MSRWTPFHGVKSIGGSKESDGARQEAPIWNWSIIIGYSLQSRRGQGFGGWRQMNRCTVNRIVISWAPLIPWPANVCPRWRCWWLGLNSIMVVIPRRGRLLLLHLHSQNHQIIKEWRCNLSLCAAESEHYHYRDLYNGLYPSSLPRTLSTEWKSILGRY